MIYDTDILENVSLIVKLEEKVNDSFLKHKKRERNGIVMHEVIWNKYHKN
jgi:hypothetical protein